MRGGEDADETGFGMQLVFSPYHPSILLFFFKGRGEWDFLDAQKHHPGACSNTVKDPKLGYITFTYLLLFEIGALLSQAGFKLTM